MRVEEEKWSPWVPRVSCAPLLFSRPFLDMVYHALDSPEDDYHALFVLCLLYAMSHNKGKPALLACPPGTPSSPPWKEESKPLSLRNRPLWVWRTPTELLSSLVRISQVLLHGPKPQELLAQAIWRAGGRVRVA